MARRSTSGSTGSPPAPPYRTPRPVPVWRCTAEDAAKPLLAFAALLLLIAGLPAVLAVESGRPLSQGDTAV